MVGKEKGVEAVTPFSVVSKDSHKIVEVWGFEPQASSLRTTRSTN